MLAKDIDPCDVGHGLQIRLVPSALVLFLTRSKRGESNRVFQAQASGVANVAERGSCFRCFFAANFCAFSLGFCGADPQNGRGAPNWP